MSIKANEIFQKMAPETAVAIFRYLRDEQREAYTTALASLAANRKLRPVFVQRKPAPAQIEWLVKQSQLRTSTDIAEHVLQLWLMKAHQSLLKEFLDAMKIPHDGEGAAEDLPESLDKKKLAAAAKSLLAAHDPEVVRIYLNVFQSQRPGGWDELAELIAKTPELSFESDAEAPAAAVPAAQPAAAAEEVPEAEEAPEEEKS